MKGSILFLRLRYGDQRVYRLGRYVQVCEGVRITGLGTGKDGYVGDRRSGYS